MSSTIAPISSTRTYAVKPAQGLRYGNFERVRNLPPIQKPEGSIERNFWTLNNEQICKTVCQWMETWQGWQQRTLLYGIANRCTISQLEILSTTLEPLRHRDYKTVSLSRYPSAPFKIKQSSKTKDKLASDTVTTKKAKDHAIPLTVTDELGNVKNVEEILKELPGGKEKKKEKRKGASKGKKSFNKSEIEVKDELNHQTDNESISTAELQNTEMPSAKMEISSDNVCTPSISVDQYASLLSSSVMISAIDEAIPLMHYDKVQFSSREASSDLIAENQDQEKAEEQTSSRGEKVSFSKQSQKTAEVEEEVEMQEKASLDTIEYPRPKSAEISVTKSASSLRKSPKIDTSRKSSAKFLGGVLEFVSDPYQKESVRKRSTSSKFRHSTFASSAASTADFFNREKLSILGPMQHAKQLDAIQGPVPLGSVPISLQKYYKNSRWWPSEPPTGNVYSHASKQELANNFKEQLQAIWEWLVEWEGHERISFIKEVLKMCSADVLDAFLTHIHQRVKDIRDINRLPDKLLLYILSFLPPQDIFQCAKVCRRWRYLCAMDDLWILKCLEIGEREGVSNLAELIEQATTQGMTVDWMLAHFQLYRLIEHFRKAGLLVGDSIESPSLSRGEVKSVDRVWTGIIRPTAGNISDDPKVKVGSSLKKGKGSVKIRLNTDVREKLEKRDKSHRSQEKRRSLRSQDLDRSDSDSAFSEEDLSPLLGEYNMMQAPPSSDEQLKSGKYKKTPEELKQPLDSVREEISTATSSQNRNVTSKGSAKSPKKKKEPEKDTALDIRTDLTQSRDLLGKMVSTSSLEWETVETYNDYMRTTLFAGELVGVKRMRKLQGHMNSVHCIYFDIRRLVTCGLDRIARLWDVRSGRSLHEFIGHKGGIRCCQFDSDILATGSWDCLVLVWDMKKFTQVATLQGHTDSVTCLQFNGDLLISGSDDKSVRLWRRPTFYCMLTIRFDAKVLSLVLFDHLFVVTTADLSTQMLDVYTGTRRKKFEPPLGPVLCLMAQKQLLLGGDAFGRVYFWNMSSGEMEAAVRVHDAAVNQVVYHKGRFFTASSDTTVKEWDLRTMTCLRVLKGHRGPVRDVKVSDRRIVTCGDDATVRIWDLVVDVPKMEIEPGKKKDVSKSVS